MSITDRDEGGRHVEVPVRGMQSLPGGPRPAMTAARERRVVETFLELTDTPNTDVDGPDVTTVLAERANELLDVTAAGVILRDATGMLSVAAATSPSARLLEVFAVAVDVGPSVECARSGRTVSSLLISADAGRWPLFVTGAAEAEFAAAYAMPMRHREQVVGVLTLLHADPHVMTDDDLCLGEALAQMATIGLLHRRAIRRTQTVTEQLELALRTRVVIAQATGVLSAQGNVSPGEAFTVLRSHARSHGLQLTTLARDVVAGTVNLTSILRPAL